MDRQLKSNAPPTTSELATCILFTFGGKPTCVSSRTCYVAGTLYGISTRKRSVSLLPANAVLQLDLVRVIRKRVPVIRNEIELFHYK